MRYTLLLLCGIQSMLLPGQDEIAPRLYPFAFQDQWGVIDEDKNVILEPSHDHIDLFYNNSSPTATTSATVDGRMGIINRAGKWQLRPRYDSVGQAQYTAQHLRWVQQDGQFGLVSTQKRRARFLFKPRFDEVSRFDGRKLGVSVVRDGDRWGAINHEGTVVADFIYDEVEIIDDFSHYPDLQLVLDGQTTYVDCWGNARTDEEMEAILEEVEMWDSIIDMEADYEDNTPEARMDLLPLDGRKGWQLSIYAYDRSSGQMSQTINLELEGYDEVKHVEYDKEGNVWFIHVRRGDFLGLLDSEGNEVSPVIYEDITPFKGDVGHGLLLHRENRMGWANYRGEQVLPPLFSEIVLLGSGLFQVRTPEGYFGYANRRKQVFLPIEY